MLLSIEWLKLRRYRTFWIISLMFLALAPISYYVFTSVIVREQGGSVAFSSMNNFETIWHNMAFMVSHFIIFLAMLVLVIGGNEYQYRTNRQNIIDGWQRLQFYHAKWQVIIAISTAVTVFTSIIGLLAGLMQGAPFSGLGNNIICLFWLFLLSINYCGFALLLITLIKRTGLAVILLIAYYIIIDSILHSLFVYKFELKWLDFILPMEVSDQLLPTPVLNSMAKQTAGQRTESGGLFNRYPAYAYAIGTLAWIAAEYFIGRRKTLKSDW